MRLALPIFAALSLIMPPVYRTLSPAATDGAYAITLDGAEYMPYVVGTEGKRNGQITTVKTVELRQVSDSVSVADLLHILNAGQITVSPPPPEPDSVGIQYVDLNGEATGRLVTHGELLHIDFEFAEDGTYALFAGDRVVQRGRWSLSKGRQFITMRSLTTMTHAARLIEDYEPGALTISLPIDVQTSEPRGVRLTSYYTPVVGLRFGL